MRMSEKNIRFVTVILRDGKPWSVFVSLGNGWVSNCRQYAGNDKLPVSVLRFMEHHEAVKNSEDDFKSSHFEHYVYE